METFVIKFVSGLAYLISIIYIYSVYIGYVYAHIKQDTPSIKGLKTFPFLNTQFPKYQIRRLLNTIVANLKFAYRILFLAVCQTLFSGLWTIFFYCCTGRHSTCYKYTAFQFLLIMFLFYCRCQRIFKLANCSSGFH